MSVVLSDYDLLRQSIECIEPKKIFLNVLRKKSDNKRRAIIDILGVDVKKTNPIYIHKHLPYKNKLYKNNMFMFIDNNDKIIGFLKGSSWDENWAGSEDYCRGTTGCSYYAGKYVVKNRKNMMAISFHVLMFEEKDLIDLEIKSYDNSHYRRKNTIAIERKEIEDKLKSTLNERVLNYKEKKYECIDGEKLKDMMNQLIVFLSNQLYDKKLELVKIWEKFNRNAKKMYSDYEYIDLNWDNEQFIDFSIRVVLNWKKEIADKNIDKYESQKNYYNYEKYRRRFLIHKLKLIDFYNLVIK